MFDETLIVSFGLDDDDMSPSGYDTYPKSRPRQDTRQPEELIDLTRRPGGQQQDPSGRLSFDSQSPRGGAHVRQVPSVLPTMFEVWPSSCCQVYGT